MLQKTHTILLADDDLDDRLLFEEALSDADSNIVYQSVNDGVALLEALSSGANFPDLILMDVNMPRMNGIDCLQALKQSEHYKSIPVIMYSTSDYHRAKCLALGAADYMEKPGSFRQLCAMLQQMLKKFFN